MICSLENDFFCFYIIGINYSLSVAADLSALRNRDIHVLSKGKGSVSGNDSTGIAAFYTYCAAKQFDLLEEIQTIRFLNFNVDLTVAGTKVITGCTVGEAVNTQ